MATFYKHDIAPWMDGTEELSHEAYRALHVIVQLIMLNEGDIVLNERGLAGRCNMPTRRFMKAVGELIDTGKVKVRNGKISNERADEELENIQKHRGNSAKGGKNSRKPKVSQSEILENQRYEEAKTLKSFTSPPSGLSEEAKEKRREEKSQIRRDEMILYHSNTSCLMPPDAGPSADDRPGQPIGMDDLPGLDSFGLAGYEADTGSGGNFDVDTPPPKPKREAKRATRIPEDWELGPNETHEWTKLGLPTGKLQFMWARFKDYWREQPGQKGVKADWTATWRNWCRREFEKLPQAAAVFGEKPVDRYNKPLNTAGTRSAV